MEYSKNVKGLDTKTLDRSIFQFLFIFQEGNHYLSCLFFKHKPFYIKKIKL